MQAEQIVIYFPKQSKPSKKKKHPEEKCTVLEWIRAGWKFPGKPGPEKPPKPKGGAQ